MAAEKLQKFIDEIKALTVLELNELVKAIEEEFGVSAAAPVMMAGAALTADAEVEEKSEFDVILTEIGPNKMAVIKVVKDITGLGLKESKDLVDGVPSKIKEGASKTDADDIKAKLEEAGGKVELK